MRRTRGTTLTLTAIEVSKLAGLLSVSNRALTAAGIVAEITRLKRLVALRCDAELSAMSAPDWVRGRSNPVNPAARRGPKVRKYRAGQSRRTHDTVVANDAAPGSDGK